MRWPTFVPSQSIRLKTDKRYDPDALKPMNGVWWTANTLYNRACYFARVDKIKGTNANLDRACRYLRDAIHRAAEPNLMLTMAHCDPVLDVVTEHLTTAQAEALTGPTEPSYKADRQRGHGIGVMVREALHTVAHADGATTPATMSRIANGANDLR